MIKEFSKNRQEECQHEEMILGFIGDVGHRRKTKTCIKCGRTWFRDSTYG
jgi:hypothetical protein